MLPAQSRTEGVQDGEAVRSRRDPDPGCAIAKWARHAAALLQTVTNRYPLGYRAAAYPRWGRAAARIADFAPGRRRAPSRIPTGQAGKGIPAAPARPVAPNSA